MVLLDDCPRALAGAVLCLFILGCQPQDAGRPQTTGDAPGAASDVTSALLDDVRALADDRMQGRRSGTEGAELARSYLVDRLRQTGARPLGDDYRRAVAASPVEGLVNLVAVVDGSQLPDRHLLLSAHYDHLGVRDDRIYNGADDNASGVATLLFVAERIAREPLRRSLMLVAFDGEELGLLGARGFVADPPVPLDAIDLVVNLDMVGRADAGAVVAAGTHHHPRLVAPLTRAARETGVAVRFGHDRPEDGPHDWTGASDHAPFFAAGIPFVYFGVEDHVDYHRPTDDWQRVDREFHRQVSILVLASLRQLDAAPVDRLSARHGEIDAFPRDSDRTIE